MSYLIRFYLARIGLALLALLSGSCLLTGQSEISLTWDTEAPVYQQDWELALRITSATSLSTAQFGLVWNNDQLLLNTVSTGETFADAVTNQQAASYTFSWVSTAAEGTELAADELVLNLSFSLLACPQDTVGLRWDSGNVPAQFTSWNNDSLTVLTAELPMLNDTLIAPNLWSAPDTSFCAGTNLLLQPDCAFCTSWTWNDGTDAATLSVDTAGTYAVTVADESACTFADSILVEMLPLPEFTLNDTTICQDDTLALTIPSADGSTYLWSTGTTQASVLLAQAGLYALTLTDPAGCQAADTFTLSFQGPVVATLFPEPQIACLGDTISIAVDGPDSLRWLTPNVLGPDELGDYYFVGEDTLAELRLVAIGVCENDTVTARAIFYRPLGFAMADTCITPGSEVRLEAFKGKTYAWSHPRFAVMPADQAVGTSSPTDTATYSVEVLDENGCLSVDSVYVAIANDPAAFIPRINFISPNGDGHNDVLEFTGLEKYTDNDLIVWNRWNQVVYRKENYQNDEERFGGQRNSHPLPDGTYYYRLRVDETIIDQEVIILRHE